MQAACSLCSGDLWDFHTHLSMGKLDLFTPQTSLSPLVCLIIMCSVKLMISVKCPKHAVKQNIQQFCPMWRCPTEHINIYTFQHSDVLFFTRLSSFGRWGLWRGESPHLVLWETCWRRSARCQVTPPGTAQLSAQTDLQHDTHTSQTFISIFLTNPWSPVSDQQGAV